MILLINGQENVMAVNGKEFGNVMIEPVPPIEGPLMFFDNAIKPYRCKAAARLSRQVCHSHDQALTTHSETPGEAQRTTQPLDAAGHRGCSAELVAQRWP